MCIKRRPKNRWNGQSTSSQKSNGSSFEESGERQVFSKPTTKVTDVEAERAKLHQLRWRKRVAPSPISEREKSSRWTDTEHSDKGDRSRTFSDSDEEMSMTPSMFLSWHNLNAYAVEKISSRRDSDLEANAEKPKKKVLNNVFGTAKPGEVLAIMGSSGAGKTSLLNTLTQRNTGTLEVEGSIKVNGKLADSDYMKRVAAYVQQDDMFFGSLTVEEHLLFCARLRMSDKFSRKAQEERVQKILTELGLRDVANSPIGTTMKRGISGGQRKRLAFASEILTSPPILLCDEPTSGLDSFLAFQVVSVLRKLAKRKGMTVVLTIHQPSSQVFELFDRIYLMAEGRVAFCGSQSEASSMFDVIGCPLPTNFNPADHYISTLAVKEESAKTDTDGVMAICDYFEDSFLGKEMARDSLAGEYRQSDSSSKSGKMKGHEKKRLDKYHASWLTQLQVLAFRNFLVSLRDPLLINIHICQAVFSAAICGFILSGNSVAQDKVLNINGMLYQMVFQLSYLMPFEAIYVCIEEFPLYHREHSSNLYRVSSYFMAKNLSEIPFSVLTATIFSVIVYLLSAVHPLSSTFLLFIFVAILVQTFVISLAYASSSLFRSAMTAIYVMKFWILSAEGVGGLFINVADVPMYFYPLTLVSYFRYAFETLVISEWKDVKYIPGNCTRPSGCPKNGDDVISSLSFDKEMMLPNVGIMILILVVLRVVAFGCLYAKTKSKK